jgi:regulator of sirC expression with transglutaminase-like and TPR domain
MTWTQKRREKLYSRLVSEIGPHRVWDEKIRPRAKRAEYDRLLMELAAEFSNETRDTCRVSAIQQQINFATTTQTEHNDRARIRSFILNKAAAIEAGFLSFHDIPQYLKVSN